jgi:hypothetical protein
MLEANVFSLSSIDLSRNSVSASVQLAGLIHHLKDASASRRVLINCSKYIFTCFHTMPVHEQIICAPSRDKGRREVTDQDFDSLERAPCQSAKLLRP